ncbi:MAG: deoxycytidylate deaminase [Geminicoccaceae bacterium]
MSRTDWDTRYLDMARLVSTWSKDLKAKVGAVIVRKNRVVATGFNGLPSDVLDSEMRLSDQEMKLNMTVHAEENALLVAGNDAEGACIYVYGKPVCCRCAGSIIQAGIRRVVAMPPDSKNLDPKSKWYNLGIIARDMFGEAEVAFFGKEIAASERVSDLNVPPCDIKGVGSSPRIATSNAIESDSPA